MQKPSNFSMGQAALLAFSFICSRPMGAKPTAQEAQASRVHIFRCQMSRVGFSYSAAHLGAGGLPRGPCRLLQPESSWANWAREAKSSFASSSFTRRWSCSSSRC